MNIPDVFLYPCMSLSRYYDTNIVGFVGIVGFVTSDFICRHV